MNSRHTQLEPENSQRKARQPISIIAAGADGLLRAREPIYQSFDAS